MPSLIEDLSILTTIPKATLDQLTEKSYSCICHNIYENILDKETVTTVDIGIGIVKIRLEDNDVIYKFIPSKKLEKYIKQTFTNNESPLVKKVEKTLSNRIINTYKDIL